MAEIDAIFGYLIKNSDFHNMELLYIILKHLTWRFQMYYLFCQILKFCNFMDNSIFVKVIKAFRKFRNLNILQN